MLLSPSWRRLLLVIVVVAVAVSLSRAGLRLSLLASVVSVLAGGRHAPCLVLDMFRMVDVVMNSGVLKRTNSALIRRCSRCLDDDLSNVSSLKFSDEVIAVPSSVLRL